MTRCSTKGCTNPAMGSFKAVTKRGSKEQIRYLDMCAGCGFTAHLKRRFVNFREDDGREVTAFPLQFVRVELERVF